MLQNLEQYNYTEPPPVRECASWNGSYRACNDGKYFCDTSGGYKDPATACKHPIKQACPSTYPTGLCKDVTSDGDGSDMSTERDELANIPRKNNMGLILGLSLGIGIPILILIILLIVLK